MLIDQTGVEKFNAAKAAMDSASAILVGELMKDRQTFVLDGEFERGGVVFGSAKWFNHYRANGIFGVLTRGR